MEITNEVIELKAFIDVIQTLTHFQASQKGIELVIQYELDPELKIISDRVSLTQILMNLTTNAIKFTPKNKTVSIKANRSENELIFQVIDQGIGISAEHQEIIFKPFGQLSDNVEHAVRGTGLGLTIVKNRLEALGGSIELESEIDKGSIFTFKVPLEEANGELEDQTTVVSNKQFSPENRVLVVEDDPINQMMIETLLKNMNLNVQVVENGAQAVEKLRAIQPHLVLMDVNMPVLSGLEAIRTIRKEPAPFNKTPIVVFSGDAFKRQQEAAFEAGADGYLTKPIDATKLLPLLNKYLKPFDKS